MPLSQNYAKFDLVRSMRDEDHTELLHWAEASGRDFPWRRISDPFVLAVTELMLVRTKAEQVSAVWDRFFARFKTLQDLAEADSTEAHELLRELGLRWRAHRIIQFAESAIRHPGWWNSHVNLPGLGPYVSCAMRIGIHGSGPVPVDVTIARVLSRYYSIQYRGEARRNRQVAEAARQLGIVSREFFNALLDHAALVCIERSPRCGKCPIEQGCSYSDKESC